MIRKQTKNRQGEYATYKQENLARLLVGDRKQILWVMDFLSAPGRTTNQGMSMWGPRG